MRETVRGSVIKAFLPYRSDKFPISGVVITDPIPIICHMHKKSHYLNQHLILKDR